MHSVCHRIRLAKAEALEALEIRDSDGNVLTTGTTDGWGTTTAENFRALKKRTYPISAEKLSEILALTARSNPVVKVSLSRSSKLSVRVKCDCHKKAASCVGG